MNKCIGLFLFLSLTVNAVAADIATSPPKRFDHKYKGQVSIHVSHNSLSECSKRGAHANACSWVIRNQCFIMLPTGLTLESHVSIVRHEIAHCNGWPASHPN